MERPIDARIRARKSESVTPEEQTATTPLATDDDLLDDIMFRPRDAEEQAMIDRWRNATMQERAQVSADLSTKAERTGEIPPKQDMFPGWTNILRRKSVKHVDDQ